jgi:hypothetical protein
MEDLDAGVENVDVDEHLDAAVEDVDEHLDAAVEDIEDLDAAIISESDLAQL